MPTASAAPLPPLPVCYATASAAAVAAHITEHYALRGSPACVLLNRGFNDTYLVTTQAAERFVLRLSGHRARGPADAAWETAFLAYLDAAGVPVAAPIPTRDGALFTTAVLPQGPRAAVLFHHAQGRTPNLDDPDDARAQGVTLARLHHAAAGFPAREAGGTRLDLDHLLHRQVAALLALDLDAPTASRQLPALAARLAQAVDRIDGDLTRIACHGDCHGLNARIATAGPLAGHAVFFDFDDGGFGYLAYDLAVHLWAQVSFGRRRHAMSHAFQAGYRSVRPVAPADEAAIPLFVAIRHIWLLGEYAGRTPEWGREAVSPAWLDREVAFLLAWERHELGARLL